MSQPPSELGKTRSKSKGRPDMPPGLDKARSRGSSFVSYGTGPKAPPRTIHFADISANQRSGFSNVFFLFNAIVATLPGVSPVNPLTAILPLLFVLATAAIADASEDYGRYKADQAANNRTAHILETDATGSSIIADVPTHQIEVGDLVYIKRGEQIPCDVVFLASSNTEGLAYIETSNLDGETNLKRRIAPPWIAKVHPTWSDITKLPGYIKCEGPSVEMYSFEGKIVIHQPNSWLDVIGFDHDPDAEDAELISTGSSKLVNIEAHIAPADPLNVPSTDDGTEKKVLPLTHKQLLLRGSQLRNTEWVVGTSVYTGNDTKLFRNLTYGSSKFSLLDQNLNQVVIFMFLFDFVILFFSAIAAGIYWEDVGVHDFYLKDSGQDGESVAGLSILTFFVIYSFIVPISLFVTITLIRVAQKKFMEWDDDLATDPNDPDTHMIVNNSNINEELGVISHIFADKTGTLTQNDMRLMYWNIHGVEFCSDTNPRVLLNEFQALSSDEKSGGTQSSDITKSELENFLWCVSSCHTVVPELDHETGELLFQTQSPDEGALVKSAAENDYILLGRTSEKIYIGHKEFDPTDGQGDRTTKGAGLARGASLSNLKSVTLNAPIEMGSDFLSVQAFELLATLEFTSERKRMSVIIRTPDNRIMLYTKGADSAILPRVDPTDPLKKSIESSVSKYSRLGLRTLVFAQREIEEREFSSWKRNFDRVEASIQHRKRRVARACREMEHTFTLIGCSAVEDRLQDKVPETISFLIDAGIHVWLLTGDKQETAINIGLSSKLLSPESELIILNADDSEDFNHILDSALATYCKGWEPTYLTNPEHPANPTSQIQNPSGGTGSGSGSHHGSFSSGKGSEPSNPVSVSSDTPGMSSISSASTASFTSTVSDISTSSEISYNNPPARPSALTQIGVEIISSIVKGFKILTGTSRSGQSFVPIYERMPRPMPQSTPSVPKGSAHHHSPPIHPKARKSGSHDNSEGDEFPDIFITSSDPDTTRTDIPLSSHSSSPDLLDSDPTLSVPVSYHRDSSGPDYGSHYKSPSGISQVPVDVLHLENVDESHIDAKTDQFYDPRLSVIIDGATLNFALHYRPVDFLSLCEVCESVICCRVTPLQKALVVRMGKHLLGRVCLAIGDGANDVSMIQEANVGVGIQGKEGTQAARASDFAIGEFQHLQKLLTVHGRYNYLRLGKVIHYSMYKNAAFILPQFYFNFYSLFSGQLIYDDWMASWVNMIYTALPPFVMGILDKQISELPLLENPALYRRLQKHDSFNIWTMGKWFLISQYHAIIFFFVIAASFGEGVLHSNGKSIGHWEHAAIALTVCVFTVLLQAALMIDFWTWHAPLSIFGSFLGFIAVYVGYSHIVIDVSEFNGGMFLSYKFVFECLSFWQLMIIIPVICLFPVIGIYYMQHRSNPTDVDIIKRIYYQNPEKIVDLPLRIPRNDVNDMALYSVWKRNFPDYYVQRMDAKKRQ